MIDSTDRDDGRKQSKLLQTYQIASLSYFYFGKRIATLTAIQRETSGNRLRKLLFVMLTRIKFMVHDAVHRWSHRTKKLIGR